jgi:hypothetical protein
MAHVWELFLSAAAAGLLLLAATTAGRAAAVRLLPGGTPFAVQTIFGAGLGLGLLGYLTLGAGLAGFASPLSCLVILALVFGASIREILELLRRAAAAGVRSFRLELGPAEAAAFAILGAFLAVTLLGALSPPFYYDGLVYHLSVPKLHLLRGFVGHVPENVHAQYPSLAQMLYLLALGLRDDIAVKLLNFGIGLVLAAAVYLFGRTFADRATGAWAAVIVLTTEAVAMTLTRVMIDAATALFPFLALFAIALWDRDECRNPRLLLLAGLLGGLAISTKYTDFWLWAILLAAVALLALKRGRGAAAILPPLLAGGTSLIVLLPWLMKTGSWTGNPVFPFFFDLLGGRPWDAWAQERFAAYNAGMGGPISWRSIYRTPLEMFLIRGSMENLTLGALFLLALPFVLADRSRPRAFALAGAVLLAYVPYWFLSARIVRYLVLVVPCAALLVAHARTALVPGSRAHRALGAVLIAGMLHNLAFFAVDELTVFEPVAVALGAETREAFLSRKLQPYEAMRFASRTLPRDAKVFFIGETRGYHLDRDYIANSAHDPSLLAALVRRTRDAGGVARELRALGVTHLLYHPGEAVRLEREYRTFNWQPGETRIVEELLTRHARELHRANGVALLELR